MIANILFVFLLNGETVGAVKAGSYEDAISILSNGINRGVVYDKVFATTNTKSDQWKDFNDDRIPQVDL